MMSNPTSPANVRSPDMMDVHYLNELLNDRSMLSTLPKRFMHVERILDQEIITIRQRLFDDRESVQMQLPEPLGEPNLHRKKIYIPESGGRHFNYVGRLLGPRGKTLKSIEQDTGCKIMIRGMGSSRPAHSPPTFVNGFSSPQINTQQFNQMFYSPSSQSPLLGNHFFHRQQYCNDENDPLHVLIQCEDTPNRADVRMSLALSLIENLFAPVDDVHDELKHKQLLELSLLRGTFKPTPSPMRRSNVNLFESGVFFPGAQQQHA